MTNNLSFSQQGSTGGAYQSPLQSAITPSWQNTMNSVQSNYNANPIKTTSIPTNTGSNNQSVIPGLLSTLKSQGGTHTTTDAAGNTQSIKINPVKNTDPAQNPTGSANTTSNGVTTGVFPPGSPQNAGPAPKPTLTPTTLPNGQQGFVNQQGDFVDANGNSIPASNNSNQSGNSPTSFPELIGAAASSAGNNSAIGQSAADIAKSYGQQIADTGVQGARAQAGYKTTGTTPVGEGNAAVNAQSTAAQQSALAQGESAALQGTGQQLTAQGQETTGLQGAANAVAPQQYGLTTQPYNPLTNSFGATGTGSSAIDRATNAANIGSAQQLQTSINDLSSTKDAADSSFTRLTNAAGSLGADTPIASGLVQLYGTTAEGSAAVTAFQTQLAAARQQWTNLGLGDAMAALPDNITKNQIAQAQQTMDKQVQANLTNFNSTLTKLQGSSGSSSSAPMFGNFNG